MLDSIYRPCDEWSEKLTMPLDDLSTADRAALEAHVAECPACSLARTDFSMIGRLLRSLPAPEFPSELPRALLQLWEEEDASVQTFASQEVDALAELLPQLRILPPEQDDTVDHVSDEMPEFSELIPLEAIKQERVTASTDCVIPDECHQSSSDVLSQEKCTTTEEVSGSNEQRVDIKTSGELILLFMLEEHYGKDVRDAIERITPKWVKDKGVRDAIKRLALRWVMDINLLILKWLKPFHFSSRKTLRCSECGCYFLFTVDDQEVYARKGFIQPPTRCPTCRKVCHAIQVTFTSSSYVTSVYQEKEPKELYKVQCEKCGQLVSIPILCGKGTSVYCNNCCRTQQIWREVDCEMKGLNVDMKGLHQNGIPIGGTGTIMLCLNGNFMLGDIFSGECTKNIAQIIEQVQHLNALNEQEGSHREEYRYSQNKYYS